MARRHSVDAGERCTMLQVSRSHTCRAWITRLVLYCAVSAVFSVTTGIVVYVAINGENTDYILQAPSADTLDPTEATLNPSAGILGPSAGILGPSILTGGWELIFRATAGNGYNVYDAWTTGKSITDIKPTSMARGTSRHYRSTSKVNGWTNVHTVKYSLFENSREVAYIIFNGTGSSNMNWFEKTRVLNSTWSTVTSRTGDFNYFSIVGSDFGNARRKFFVNVLYDNCNGDLGYTVVIDKDTVPGCTYDVHSTEPQFLYSKINSADFWNRMMFGRAEYMAVFYKTV